MLGYKEFDYVPGEHESEKASNSYLISLIAIKAGLPFPIFNLLATVIFYLNNRKGLYFVRWHCTQALLLQCSLFCMNAVSFYWTLSIIFGNNTVSNTYFAYLGTILLFNLIEYIVTIYTAIKTRKGQQIEWWFYGTLTNLICKP